MAAYAGFYQRILVLVMALGFSSLAISAQEQPPALRASRFYLVSELSESQFQLLRIPGPRALPVEQAVWYGSVPSAIVGYGVTTGAYVKMGLAALLYAKLAVPLLLLETKGRLEIEAWLQRRKKRQALQTIPGIQSVFSMNGHSMIRSGSVIDQLLEKTLLIVDVDGDTPIPPSDFRVEVQKLTGVVSAQLEPIPQIENLRILLSLRSPSAAESVPDWTIHFHELNDGLKMPPALLQTWWDQAQKFPGSAIELRVDTGLGTYDMGHFVGANQVASFLGQGELNRLLFYPMRKGSQLFIKKYSHLLNSEEGQELPQDQRDQLQKAIADLEQQAVRTERLSQRFARLLTKKMKLNSTAVESKRSQCAARLTRDEGS